MPPDFHHTIAVFGDRDWIDQDSQLVATDPQPFTSMPLTYENAYGGKVKLEEGDLPCAPNPMGKGYYLTAEQAHGQPLPNLEDPDHLIRVFEVRLNGERVKLNC